MPVPEFGVPWAADGETRPGRYRTPLAWCAGFGGGAIWIQFGASESERIWMLLDEWEHWVASDDAKPVAPPDAADAPWDDPDLA